MSRESASAEATLNTVLPPFQIRAFAWLRRRRTNHATSRSLAARVVSTDSEGPGGKRADSRPHSMGHWWPGRFPNGSSECALWSRVEPCARRRGWALDANVRLNARVSHHDTFDAEPYLGARLRRRVAGNAYRDLPGSGFQGDQDAGGLCHAASGLRCSQQPSSQANEENQLPRVSIPT